MLKYVRSGLAGIAVALFWWLSASPAFAQSCPGNAPLNCGAGCCPFGDGGRMDVCCPNNQCTRSGSCGSSGGGGDVCPSSAPIDCGSGCCPIGDGGRTDVCCPNNQCTRNGSCNFNGNVTVNGGNTSDEICVDTTVGSCTTSSCGNGTTCLYKLNGDTVCTFSCDDRAEFDDCTNRAALELAELGERGACGGVSSPRNEPSPSGCANPCGNICCRSDQTCGIGVESGVAACYNQRAASDSPRSSNGGPSGCANPCGNICCRSDQTCGIGVESGVAACYDQRCANPCGNICCRSDQTCGIGIESGAAACYDRRPGNTSPASSSSGGIGSCAHGSSTPARHSSTLMALLLALFARRQRGRRSAPSDL